MQDLALGAVQRVDTAELDRGIHADLAVQTIIQPGVHTDTPRILLEAAVAAVDFGGSGRCGRGAAAGIGESPGLGGVPNVLDGGVVIDGNPQHQAVILRFRPAADIDVPRVAHIRIVESELVGGAVIGELHEGAEIVGDLAGVEKARLLREQHVAVLGERTLDGAVGKCCAGVGVGDLQHDADGRQRVQGQRFAVFGGDPRDLLDVVEHIAVQLEFAAEGGQFRKDRVAGRTGHAGLSGEARHREARSRQGDI